MKFSIKSLIIAVIFCVFANFNAFADDLKKCKKLIDDGLTAVYDGKYPQALEILTKAQLMAEKNQWYDQVFTAKNNIGIIYFYQSDYGEALNYYLECYSIAIKHLDAKREMTVLNNIAVMYSAEKNFDKGEEYFKKAYDIAKEENDKPKIGLYGLNLARVANKKNKFELGKKYLDEAGEYVRDDPRILTSLKLTIIENLLLTGNIAEAKSNIKAISATIKTQDKNSQVELLGYMADIAMDENKYEEAISYAKQALEDNPDLDSRVGIFDKMAEMYIKKNEFGEAIKAKDSAMYTKDSLTKIKNSKFYENNKVKFELQNYKNQLSLNQERLNIERVLFFSALGIVLLLLFFVYRLLSNRATKQKQEKIISEREQQIIALELEQEKSENLLLEKQVREIETEAMLKHNKLTSEIEQKNRKLSARALYLSGRNEMIEEIVDSLSVLPEISMNNTLKKQIRTLKEHLKTDSEWNNFITHFEEVNQGLLHALKEKHENLTSNDIRFICYVYMNLSSKEICSIFNITQEACRKRKERISRKMNIDESISMYEYLSKVTQ